MSLAESEYAEFLTWGFLLNPLWRKGFGRSELR